MSIEAKLDALTAALNRNSDLLDILTAKAKAGVADAGAKTAEKAPAKAEDKAPAKTEAAEPKKTTRATKEKPPTPADMAKATTDFLEVDDEGEYTARRAFVKKVIAKYGAEKMSVIAEEDRKEALAYLTAFAAGDATDLDDEEQEEELA